MKSWTWPLVCAALLLLSLWGFWGEGTASKLLPEKEAPAVSTKKAPVPKTEEVTIEEIEGDKPVKRYDASLYVRAKPLQDPFHMDAIKEANQQKKEEVKETSKTPAKKKVAPAGETLSYASEPTLRGIMAFGSEKRAIIECQGQSMTVREGESAGPWKVSSIGEKTVTLAGASGVIELSTR